MNSPLGSLGVCKLMALWLLPSAQSSSHGGRPAQGRSRIRGKALACPLPSGMCRPESSLSNTKTQGKHSGGIRFPSAEPSNLPEQPRGRLKAQPTEQGCRLSRTPRCRKSSPVPAYDKPLQTLVDPVSG